MRNSSRPGRALPATLTWLIALAWSVSVAAEGSRGPAAYEVPEFRQVIKRDIAAELRRVSRVRIAIEQNFPPFSYRNAQGLLTGLFPVMANSICSDLRLRCEFVVLPHDDLASALEDGKVDAVLSGLVPDPGMAGKIDFTRAFLRPTARFAVRNASPIETTQARALAGKRLGVVSGTSHARFIAAHYRRSSMVEFSSHDDLFNALRTARVDAVFADSFRTMFWLQGTRSRSCCQFVGGGFFAPESFSRGMAFALRREDRALRHVLDYGLDQFQASGKFAAVYRRFFPNSPL